MDNLDNRVIGVEIDLLRRELVEQKRAHQDELAKLEAQISSLKIGMKFTGKALGDVADLAELLRNGASVSFKIHHIRRASRTIQARATRASAPSMSVALPQVGRGLPWTTFNHRVRRGI